MIKLEKKAIYYLKDHYHHESRKDTKTFYNMDEALKVFESLTPQFYINKKDISTIEEITLYFTSEFGIKSYYKRIDPTNETIESNYKRD